MHIVHERFGICPEPKSEGGGHRDLSVRVTGQEDRPVLFAEGLQQVEKFQCFSFDLPDLILEEEFQVHQHLIVP